MTNLIVFDESNSAHVEAFVTLHKLIWPDKAISVIGFRSAEPVRRNGFWTMVLAEVDGVMMGFARAMTSPFAQEAIDVNVAVQPMGRCRGHGTRLAEFILARAGGRPERIIETMFPEDDMTARRFAETHGMALHALRVNLQGSTALMRTAASVPQGYRLDRIKDWKSAHELYRATIGDNPDGVGAPTYEVFRHLTVDNAGFLENANLGAYVKGRLIGMTLLQPLTRELARNVYTTVSRKHRGKGLAKALKARQVVEARRRGVVDISTDVNSSNKPMLAVNEWLGMQRTQGYCWMRGPNDSPN